MRLLDRQSTTAPPGNDAASSPRLCVRAEGHFINLPLGKFTIGSSARCDLRIQQPGIQPLHCLIVRDAAGLSVRRWGGDTLLNGQTFDEAVLQTGDCLFVASVELEIVAPPSASQPQASPVSKRAPETAANQHLGMVGELRGARNLARSRSRKLLAVLRREREAHDRELHRQYAEFEQQVEQGAADRNNLAGDHQMALSELADVRQQLEEHRAQGSAQHEIVIENERLGSEVRSLTERIEQISCELQTATADRQNLGEEKAAFNEERQQLADENGDLRSQLEHLSHQVATLGGERDQLREQLEKASADMQVLGGEKAALADEWSAHQSRLDKLREQNQKLQSDSQLLSSEKATLADERTQLRNERDALCEQIERLRAEMRALDAESAARSEQQAELCGERDGYRRQYESLHKQFDELAAEKAALADERAALSSERDDLRVQNETLQADLQSLASEQAALAEDRSAIGRERDQLRVEVEQLQAGIANLDEEISAVTTAKSAFEEERDWLREENQRFAEVERQMRAAVADRENMSAELYRVLLQAAELQKHVDEHDALAEAHQALDRQHMELTAQLTKLQEEIDRLVAERADSESAQQSLAEEAATARDQQERWTNENAELIARLNETTMQLEDAARQREELEARLQQENDELCRQLEQAQQSQAALAESATEWERELAAKQQVDEAADAKVAETERQFAEQTTQLAALNDLVHLLEQQLTVSQEAQQSLEIDRDSWQIKYAEATRQLDQQANQMMELESKLAAVNSSPTVHETTDSAQASVADEANRSTEKFDCQYSDRREPAVEPDVPDVADMAQAESSESGEVTSAADGETLSKEATLDPSFQDVARISESAQTSDAIAVTEDDSRSTARQEATAAEGAPAPSYIERYAHLFDDEDRANGTPAGPAPSPRSVDEARNSEVLQPAVAASANTAGDEESIEQYMAKLLQRTRGQSAGPAELPGSLNAESRSPLAHQPMNYEQPTGGVDDRLSSPAATKYGWAANSTPGRRKNSTPAPQTDLEALRALANESARRAISRHSLRKLRKNALTKVIVAALAGVTGLWQILESADWRSSQFISACGLLIVAAYWAGQTYSTLLVSLRENAFEEPDDDVDDMNAEFQSPLPIDVEAPSDRTSC